MTFYHSTFTGKDITTNLAVRPPMTGDTYMKPSHRLENRLLNYKSIIYLETPSPLLTYSSVNRLQHEDDSYRSEIKSLPLPR